jgi:hypothetical protein
MPGPSAPRRAVRRSLRKFLLAGLLFPLLAAGCSDGKAEQGHRSRRQPAIVAKDDEDNHFAQGALDMDCSHGGRQPEGGYQFLSPCEGLAPSPDGAFAVARKKEDGVVLVDARGRAQDDITALNDAMPFVVFWAPNSRWFFVNHYLGSDLERLRVFEIVNRVAIERSAVFAEATRVMLRHYPCLGIQGTIVASGWRWSRDSRRIALVAYARPDACVVERRPGVWRPAGDWEALWMIGDVESGRIDPASVRVRKDAGPFPKDGPYAAL